MSDTTTDDARQAAATEPSATEPVTTPVTETAPPPGGEQTASDQEPKAETTPPPPDPRDRAIRQLAFEQRETRRQLAAAREQLDRLAPRDPNTPPSQAEFDRVVAERAELLVAQRETQARNDAWISKGNADFADFTARCNAVADMGAGENTAFMAAIARVPDGHKVIAALADNPAETTRILKLPPIDLALEVAALAHRASTAAAPAPRPTSQAPSPIRPLATAARAEPNPERMSEAEFQTWWNKRTRG